MSDAIELLRAAQQKALRIRPRVGGFPVLAEVLRRAGVRQNLWTLPAGQSLYIMDQGVVVDPGQPLTTGMTVVPPFDEAALVAALRADQAGETTFPVFLMASWRAGVVRYEVDFAARVVTYFGARGESYAEHYPAVDLPADALPVT